MTLNYFSPFPLLTPRWRQASLRARMISQLGHRPTIKLNLDKTELLFHPGKACPLKDLSITVDNSTVSPSQSTKILRVI